MVSFEMNDMKKIGIGLTGFGVFFSFLGIIFFFDKGLIAMGNILFLSGLGLTIGLKSTLQFFAKPKNYKGTISFGAGFFLVLIGWPFFGMILEAYGFIVLFSGFWPTLVVFLQRIPIIGWIFQQPFVTSFLDRYAVDDDPVCLKVLETLLRRCQYHVTTTNQAVVALKMLRENREMFDLVISDVHMPDMDGFKLLELVGLEMDLPVIMLSVNGETKTVMKGITHGACDYLLKPVRIEELRNIWQHVVRRKFSSRDRANIDAYEECNKPPNADFDHVHSQITCGRNSHRAHAKVKAKLVFKRPYCDDFLRFCFQNFELGIWSSRLKDNVNSVVNILTRDLKQCLLFCWDMSHCTVTGRNTVENKHKPLVLKELKKLWNKEYPNLPWEQGEFSPSNTLLVDDSPYKALCNPPHTAIFPQPYSYLKERSDYSLGPGGDLRVYLERLAAADDVQVFVRENPFGQPSIMESDPHWNFYAQIVDKVEKSLA